jgi:hypothetical protein
MPHEIKQWKDIADNYDDTVLLGNGASAAVNKSFLYGSLLERALADKSISEDVQLIFDFFKTPDFEFVLRTVWQATNINSALKIEDKRTREAYENIRTALIQAVRQVHPGHDEVSVHFEPIYHFLKRFKTVLSLNYDLIVYWTTMFGIDLRDGHSFKDCFPYGEFREDWEELRTPIRGNQSVTLVFYPHGNLALARDKSEQESKIFGGDGRLLDAILARWESEDFVPLFVSEGTWHQKVSAIRTSYYLSTVYREVLTSDQSTLVIYGWALGDHDVHILNQIKRAKVERVAISVYEHSQSFCNHAEYLVREKLGAGVEVEFFDSASDGCWIHPTR